MREYAPGAARAVLSGMVVAVLLLTPMFGPRGSVTSRSQLRPEKPKAVPHSTMEDSLRMKPNVLDSAVLVKAGPVNAAVRQEFGEPRVTSVELDVSPDPPDMVRVVETVILAGNAAWVPVLEDAQDVATAEFRRGDSLVRGVPGRFSGRAVVEYAVPLRGENSWETHTWAFPATASVRSVAPLAVAAVPPGKTSYAVGANGWSEAVKLGPGGRFAAGPAQSCSQNPVGCGQAITGQKPSGWMPLASVKRIVGPIMARYGIPEHVWLAIMLMESGGDPTAWALTPWEDSRGLFQINLLAHPQLKGANLWDPATNAEIAARDFIAPALAAVRGDPDPGKQAMVAWRDGIRPFWTQARAEAIYGLARRIAGLPQSHASNGP